MALTTDSSTNNLGLTANGDVTLNTSIYKNGGGSAYFNGDGNYLTVENPSQTLINWFESDFTIETWIYLDGEPTDTPSASSPMIGNGNPTTSEEYWSFGPTNSLSVKFKYWNDSEQGFETSSSIISLGEWYHIAFVKNGTNLKIYVDGVEGASSELVGTPIVSDAVPLVIGGQSQGIFFGYIDDLQILKGVAKYTSNFTPSENELPDPYDSDGSSVSLLLHMDGANGSTAFTDSSLNNFAVTANGDAQISTAEKKIGNGSAYFDGGGDYLELPSDTAFDFGAGDFTVEAWINPSSFEPSDHFIINSIDAEGLFLGWRNSTDIGWGRCNVAWDYSTDSSMVVDTWYHVALTRSGSQMRLFVNGQQVGETQTNTLSYNLGIGGVSIANQTGFYFNGYIDELRVTKGVARYTANFTPQTAPFPNPSLLSQGLLAFWKLDDLTDSSGNGNSLTDNSNVTFGAGKIENAATFDGSNYLSRASSSNWILSGTGATVNFWLRRNGSANSEIIGNRIGAVYCPWALALDSNDTLRLLSNVNGGWAVTSGGSYGNTTIPDGTWVMITIRKSTNGITVLINGSADSGITNVPSPTNTTSSPLYIGSGGDGSFVGSIDAIGFWSRSITDEEIAILYNDGNGIEI